MKKLAAALFFLMTAAALAGHYDKEEHLIESKLYKNFPVLEEGKDIIVEEIEVDIEKNGKVEIDIEFSKNSQVDTKNYKMYADKIASYVNEVLKETNENFVLKKIEIDTSGVHNDKETFRY